MTTPPARMPLYDLASATRQARVLARDFAPLVAGRASIASDDRIAYARDLWPKAILWARAGLSPLPPDLVVWPETVDEVVAVTRRAGELGVPLVPFGAGSGVCGGTLAVRGGIVMDLKRMGRLRGLDQEALVVDAEAGIIGEILERRLNRRSVTLGHFPASIYCSTLGGWLACRGAGQASTRYGKVDDMVSSITAVDGRGEVLEATPRPHSGVDLAQFLMGSEGVLATITSARMHVTATPEARLFRSFRFKGVRAGLSALRALLQAGLRPAVARLYDPFDTLIAGRDGPGKKHDGAYLDFVGEGLALKLKRLALRATLHRPIGLNQVADLLRECLLILVFEGPADLCDAEDEEAGKICLTQGGEDLGVEPARRWLDRRYAVSYKQSKVFDAGAFVDTMEVSATWDRVVEIYDRVRFALSPLAFVMCHFSHAYVEGCALYFTFASAMGDVEDAEARYDEIWRTGLVAARSAGASVSHHHGVGLAKVEEMKEQLGDGMRLLKGLKSLYDPKGIMNPGKLGL